MIYKLGNHEKWSWEISHEEHEIHVRVRKAVTMGNKRRYITGLDGIRTLAVLGVIIYHLFPNQLPGGYLGVTIFFVVSGYLITDLLNQEWIQNGKIDVRGFYKRRFQRLYPALIVLLASASTYIVLFQQDLLKNLRAVVLSSVLYVNNWWQISNDMSYFEQFGTPSPFTHIWSLAVEAQFYLIWPFICIIFYHLARSATRASFIIAGLTIMSAGWMAWLYVPGVDPTRIYYGTDTRMFSILIGCWLAFMWPSALLVEKTTRIRRWGTNLMGIAALAYLVYAFRTLKFDDPFLYHGGMVLVSVAAAVLVAAVVNPAANMNRIMSNPIFSWIGTRSYGIYLYQSPVMVFYDAKMGNVNDNVLLNAVIEVIIILVLSELSYRMFERPLRRVSWASFKQYVRDFFRFRRLKFKRTSLLVGIILLSMMGYALKMEPLASQKEQSDFEKHLQETKERAEKTKEKESEPEEPEEPEIPEYDIYGNLIIKEKPEEEDDSKLTSEQKDFTKNMPMTAIGDSMALDALPTLEKYFPKLVMDAEVGRQLFATAPVINNMLQTQGIQENVLMILGTNGSFTEEQFKDIMDLLGNRHVYWVNVRVPTGRWQNDVNEMLTKMEKKYDNLTVIDWYQASEGEPNWFYDDRVHPNEEGQIHYADAITDAILKENKID